MSGDGWIWDSLGIAETGDVGEVRRAYARRLKTIDTEADPRAFIELRAARDSALAFAAGDSGPAEPPLLWPQPAPPEQEAPAAPWPEPLASTPESAPAESAVPDSAPPTAPDAPPAPIPAPDPPLPAPDPPPPDPGPLPPMVVARSAMPEIDAADLDHVDALLGAAEPPSWPALQAAIRRVLGSPAAERIDVANWLEGWTAERIAAFTPRSDAMIDPAIEHFRWDRAAELNRPPIVDWILQRRSDREFEIQLSALPGGYSRLIAELRRPLARPPGRLGAWWKGIRVEFLLAYLDALNPTILTGLNPDTLAWWQGHIAARHEAPPGHARSLRERLSKQVFDHGIVGPREVTPLMMLGLLFIPYICVWFLLQRGYGAGIRILGFGWLAIMVLAILFAPPPPEQTYQGRSIEPHYLDMETDVGPVVAWASEGKLALEGIAGTEPALFRALSEYWYRAERERESGPVFREAIAEILRKSWCEGRDSQAAASICAAILARRAAEEAKAAAAPEQAWQPLARPVRAYGGPPAPVNYESMEQDVDPILGWITGDRLNVDRLRNGNLTLYSALIDRWNRAEADRTPGDRFQDEIAAFLRDDIRSVLRGGRYELQSAYWRLFADQAAYARTISNEACEAWLEGDSNAVVRFEPEIEARSNALAARALVDPEYHYLRVFGAPREQRSLTVPPSIASRAAYLAGMEPSKLSIALIGGGTAAERCDARIGLIEATLAQPKEKAMPVLQQLADGF